MKYIAICISKHIMVKKGTDLTTDSWLLGYQMWGGEQSGGWVGFAVIITQTT